MIKNFQELVSQIKTQIPIQELISEFIPVKKSGRGFAAVCPFHDDHHPSLQIHPQKGIFKCFSCGTGGDLITFYALINKKKWSEAIPELAEKYGFKIEYTNENKTETYIKSQLLELNQSCISFFKNILFSESGKTALDYLLQKRKLSYETIEKYEIGYTLNSWDALYNHLSKEKAYSHELIIASGLFVPRENEQGHYDRFRNRIIFPIYNEQNKVIAFGGRTLSDSKSEAKYINSPETLLFNKGQNLYGLNFGKEEIIKKDFAILTEGYFDVVTAHQYGLLNTVATLGTAMTSGQLRLLTKYTDSKKVFICLDTDKAGEKAVESIFKLVQEFSSFYNFDLKVVSFTNAKDLDEALNNSGAEEVASTIKNGKNLYKFIMDKKASEYHNEADDFTKKNILNEISELIASIKDPFEQKENTNHVSHKLNIDEEIITIKIKERTKHLKERRYKYKFNENKKESEADNFTMHTDERFMHAEIELLSLYTSSFPQFHEIKEELKQIDFIDEKTKLIKDHIDLLVERSSTLPLQPNEVIDSLMLEFNEYKHIMSTISDIAWRIELDENNYIKNKSQIVKEAKEWISWWVTNKQKLKSLTEKLKGCNDKAEENNILSQMVSLIRSKV